MWDGQAIAGRWQPRGFHDETRHGVSAAADAADAAAAVVTGGRCQQDERWDRWSLVVVAVAVGHPRKSRD